jgi:paraquat-inducible protein B
VGQVLDVGLEFDDQKQEFRIPVLLEFEPERVFPNNGLLTAEKRRQLMDGLVEQGYRAQLESGNLLTGQLIVTMHRFPDAAPAAIDWREPYPIYPTVPKTIQQIKVKVARIIDRMDKMPIEQIGKDLQAAVHGAKRLVDSPELARSLKNLDTTIEEARLMMSDLRSTVAPQLNATLEEARQAMESASEMLKTDSPLQIRMKSALDEVARASRSLRQLMDYLERHPESIISGKGSDE